ncbi:MAG: dihydroneopterin aldolase [Gemmatimonas sp.]|nr:dihydroneopterin aldolase [Gemmatimonas sp.]
MDCIRLTGIDVYAYHGAHPAERELGQRFVIDVELWTDVQGAAVSDSMQDALDYTLVHQRIIELTAGESFQLLEALAGRICDMLLTEFALDAATVTVHKPNPPIKNFLGSVSVTIDRTREDLLSRKARKPLHRHGHGESIQ